MILDVPDCPGKAERASVYASPRFLSGLQTGTAPRCRTSGHPSWKQRLYSGLDRSPVPKSVSYTLIPPVHEILYQVKADSPVC